MCVPLCIGVDMQMSGSAGDIRSHIKQFSTLFFADRFLTEPGPCSLAGRQAPEIFLSPLSRYWDHGHTPQTWLFTWVLGITNQALHTLLTEPLLQPLDYHFSFLY